MKRYLLFFVAILFLPLIGHAQTTGATIEGTVMTGEGQPLPGANVVAIHEPTGSRYGASTLSNGSYTLSSVRVGGPYVIKVTFVGYNAAKKVLNDIELGETLEVDFSLQEGSIELEELTVTGQIDPIFNENVTGAKTNISTEEIARVPTLERSLQDFLRLSPYASSGFSFGGSNDRYNTLLVDGATLNDVFGLGTATPGSSAGVASPISIDAIAEFNVALAPFGVTNNGFTGARVNAITRSGTNNYSGSVYYYTRNEAFAGQYLRDNGTLSPDLDQFQQRFIGLRLGGPIVQNELFFFVSAEIKRESSPLTTVLGTGPDEFPVDASIFQEISQITQNQYGYTPGGFGNPLDVRQDNYKILAKIDWNISQDNKLMFRYNFLDATDEEGISRSSGGYSFANRQYNFNSKLHSFVAELNSNFSTRTFNTFRVVYTRIRDSRDVVDEPFPLVSISYPVNPDDFDFRPITLGIDRFSQANQLYQDLIEVSNNLTYITGNHEFTFGTSNKLYFFDNFFVQDAFGTYEFRAREDGDSVIENFRQGDPFSFQYSYLLPGGNPRAQFPVLQLGLYAQDRYTVNDRLTVTLGLRIDVPFLPEEPTFNEDVPEAFPGYTTSRVASGNPLWSPRFGFNWDLSTDDSITQLRGGVGIFSGPPPIVWISNQYSNTGVDYGRLRLEDFINEDGEYVNVIGPGFFSGDPNVQPNPLDNPNLIPINTTAVNLISEDFKYPQALKVNLAVDQELPFGISATLEGIYTKAMNAVVFKNLNVEQVGTSVHGRPLYSDNPSTFSGPQYVNEGFTNAILLENTGKGYGYSISGQLQKQFFSGLYLSLAYTYNIQKRVNSGNSSRAISNWQFNESVDPNNPQLAITDYNRQKRFLANVSYRFDYADGFATTVSVILDTHSGSPYSWIYFGNANGDTQSFNDLLYVPELLNDVGEFDDIILISENPNDLNAFINSHPSLFKKRGEFVDANSANTPWETLLDLSISQRIPTFDGQSLELSLNMFNVLNFISEEWGKREFVQFGTKTAWTFVDYVDQGFINENPDLNLTSADMGEPVVSFDPFRVYESNLYETLEIASRWRLQLGVRYNF